MAELYLGAESVLVEVVREVCEERKWYEEERKRRSSLP
jgi:hypothetical protein